MSTAGVRRDKAAFNVVGRGTNLRPVTVSEGVMGWRVDGREIQRADLADVPVWERLGCHPSTGYDSTS